MTGPDQPTAAEAESAETAMRRYLARIAERERRIGAWACVDPDRALAAARAADAAPAGGPLHGRAVGVKDVIDTADMPTAYGSPIYDGHRPAADAACVAALRKAGAVVMGKTATTEFAAIHPPRTVNPHDPARTPGGSSSGSAAAVADGMCWAALGTQTAGSTIRPAAFCGVVGYKPSFGTVSRAGLKPLSEFTDTIGVVARTVADAGLVVAAMAERPELAIDATPPARPPRIALCRTAYWDQAEPAGRDALAEAADRLRAAGAEVAARDLPATCAGLADAGMTILVREARLGFGHELATAPDLISPELRELLARDAAFDLAAYDAARALAVRCRTEVAAGVLAEHDAILTLSAAGEAPVGLTSTGSPVFNHPWTLLHLPCVNVPGLVGPAGMPVGVQLVGRLGDDAGLLRLAQWAQTVLAT